MAYLENNDTSGSPNGTGGGQPGGRSSLAIPLVPYSIGFIFSFLAVSLNGILILVMVKERKSFFNSRVSYFVLNLAVADCLTGICLFYVNVLQLLPKGSTVPRSVYVSVVNWTAIQSSFYTLFLMSVDRLVIVLYFKRWSKILTIKRTLISIKIVWLVAITAGILMYFYIDETLAAVVLFVDLCIVLFVFNSLFIYPVLRKREKGRFEEAIEMSNGAESSNTSASVARRVANDKMSHVVVILMVVLIVTQLPFLICFQIYLLNKLSGMKNLKILTDKRFIMAYTYSQTWASINFIVNPIVYAWRIRTYRKALLNTFTILK